MSNDEKLEILFQRVAHSGWHGNIPQYDDQHGEWVVSDGNGGYITPSIIEILLSHEFAKALWPPEDAIGCPYCGLPLTGRYHHPMPCPFASMTMQPIPLWVWHLQQAVISVDLIGYMYIAVTGDRS